MLPAVMRLASELARESALGQRLDHFKAAWADLSELIKLRLNTLVLLTTAIGFAMARPATGSWWPLLHVLLGTGAVAAGSAVLNQLLESTPDARMERTRERPLPTGRAEPRNALCLGVLLSGGGISYLVIACNYTTGMFAALTLALYIFLYTPLKRLTSLNTLVGAIPGALPPVIGWVAARHAADPAAWALFGIQFFWQLPHFYAIAWLHRQDYPRGGFVMLANGDEQAGRSSLAAVLSCLPLLLMAPLPWFLGLAGPFYLASSLLLSAAYLAAALRFRARRTTAAGRVLFLASLLYLPLLFITLLADKA
jgi:heme o synthase